MASKKVCLEPHPIWDYVIGINSFEDYKNYLPMTILSENVDDEIKAYYQPISKLLEFGYLEYSFITLAFRNALIMLELILKRYYLKSEPNPKQKIMLNDLIEWFSANKLINEQQRQQLSMLKELRNSYSHPSQNSVMTIQSIKVIDVILIIANNFS